MMRFKGYIGISFVCFFYWILDSIWSYLSFEYNLKKMIFSEPVSYLDTFLLKVSPYQIVSRLMVVFLFIVLGSIIIEFMIKMLAAEKKRKESHDTLLTILNSIDATIYVSDMHSHEVLFMNRFMIDSFGRNFSGCICYEVFSNSSKVCDQCPCERLVDSSGNPKGVVIWEGRNPVTKSWYINYDRAIRWIDGRIVHLQVATDITQLKALQEKNVKAEDQLRQAQKMESIGSLAGGIAHDLNNILFPISGLSEMLLDDIPPDTPEHKSIEQIHKSAKRGSDLVKQILAFSRQSNPQKLPILIQPILKEVLQLAHATIPRNIEIKSHITTDCGMVLADPTQVHQIAMNLITNAYHAVEGKGGIIDITLKEAEVEKDDLHDISMNPDKYVCITVSDTGTGIDKTLIDKIFDPYFTTKEMGKGTGLGLSVVHGIVKEHGGDIRVYSEVGKGTAFHVYLPLLEDGKEKKDAAVTRKYPKGLERILLVDDEEPIARMLKTMLERLGYLVTVRTSSPDALDAFRADPSKFDIVISDKGMPNMTGEQLAGELISIRPGIPIILCTGFSDENDEKRARDLGVKGFLKKPVARGDLAEMVRKVLDESKGTTP